MNIFFIITVKNLFCAHYVVIQGPSNILNIERRMVSMFGDCSQCTL